MEKVIDMAIVGAGPAGMTAAIYGQRAGLSVVILEKNTMGGGQMTYTDKIENYTGIEAVDGFELSMKMQNQVKNLGVRFLFEEVKEIQQANDNNEAIWELKTNKSTILARNVVYSGGASHKKLEVPGEIRLAGRGVSYCATCDGNFFRGKTVAVVGGGNTALQDALYLSQVANKVYLIHRRDKFRGFASNVEKVEASPNIEIIYNSNLGEIKGEDKVNSLIIVDNYGGNRELSVDGVFIAVPAKIQIRFPLRPDSISSTPRAISLLAFSIRTISGTPKSLIANLSMFRISCAKASFICFPPQIYLSIIHCAVAYSLQ